MANENERRAAAHATRLAATERAWDLDRMAMPWVESPFFDALLERSDLDEQQRQLARQFSEQGYVIFDPEIPDATIDAVIDGLDSEWGKVQDPWNTDTRIMDSELSQVRAIAGWAKVIDVLRMLYRREPIPFQTLNFEVGTEQGVHTDTIHFHAVPHRFMCGVWIAFEDVDSDNGPLFYYPGSHKLPIYEMSDFGLPSSPGSYAMWEQAVQALMAASGCELAELHVERGQALVWAANLHHGGRPIRDRGRTRLSQVTHYFFEDTLMYSPQGTDLITGRLQLRDVCDLRTGAMVAHCYRGECIHRPTRPGLTILQPRGGASESNPSRRFRWNRLRRRR